MMINNIDMAVTTIRAVQEYEQICNKVKSLDERIRFAGIINNKGKLIAGGMKSGIEPLERKNEDEMLFMELALRVKMRKDFDEQLGSVNFAMASREKSLEISVTITKDDVLYVVGEPDTDYTNLPKKIIDIISHLHLIIIY